ncbi:MAG TPA: GspH/FimT family pseudopilin [Paucimonas sp.]|nr:GspH/FimT family pseudopilin [Paucimonas sp.]HJW54648.1 GspH/FimT family pseudopilin [Burkholderiaceae bacterium]
MRTHPLLSSVNRIRGFTLIELMVVLGIAAILLGIGVPSFRTLLQNQRLTTTVNEFFSAVNLTRAEAIKAGLRVDMVPADADATDWTQGWIVFIDDNDNQKPDAGERIIQKHEQVPDGIAIDSKFTDSAAATKYISYNGTGRTQTNAGSQSPQSGTVSFTQDASIRRIKLNFIGRPRVCNPVTEPVTCTATADSK